MSPDPDALGAAVEAASTNDPDSPAWKAVCEREAAQLRREVEDGGPATTTDVEREIMRIGARVGRRFPAAALTDLSELLIAETSPRVGEIRAAVDLFIDTAAAEARFPPSAGSLLRCVMRVRQERQATCPGERSVD